MKISTLVSFGFPQGQRTQFIGLAIFAVPLLQWLMGAISLIDLAESLDQMLFGLAIVFYGDKANALIEALNQMRQDIKNGGSNG